LKTETDEYFMGMALQLAQEAALSGEVPVGAVVVSNSRIIAKSRNQTEQLNDVTAHAEILAITAAEQFLGAKYLKNCTLYVTLEPCVMCAGAIFWSQLGRLVVGAKDDKRGFSKLSENVLHPKTQVTMGVLELECEEILKIFFKKLRT
jgi:tRNA(adenine34) deaminase